MTEQEKLEEQRGQERIIKGISLKYGENGEKMREVPVDALTIFVGPNNSGKSLVLREIQGYLGSFSYSSSGLPNVLHTADVQNREGRKMLHFITSHVPETESLKEKIATREAEGIQMIRGSFPSGFIDLSDVPNSAGFLSSQKEFLIPLYFSGKTLFLDGKTRLDRVKRQNSGDFNQPKTTFQFLNGDDALREKWRSEIHLGIGRYPVFDMTEPAFFKIKLSDIAPDSAAIERSVMSEALSFHQNTFSIEDSSDGVKAFVGILTEILSGQSDLILLDEPEAFLHPPLAEKLGSSLGKFLKKNNKYLFCATHSSHFLMGCILSKIPLNIVRLTYEKKGEAGISTIRHLSNDDILPLMRDPLLRSTNLLSALFYEHVIITEADSDRCFYQEINQRLLDAGDERGIPNCLFLNAQNKQTISRMLAPLRKMGIPAAAIFDIDYFKDGDCSESLVVANISKTILSGIKKIRGDIGCALKNANEAYKTKGGIECLSAQDKEGAESHLKCLGEYGLFVVPQGELESWLRSENISYKKKKGWLIQIFEKMGSDPEDEAYIKPSQGDVWDFIGEIKKWLTNPTRKGIPQEEPHSDE